MGITYTKSLSITDLKGILILQDKNLKKSLDQKEVESQGFVTVVHDLDLLREMNQASKHIIAKSESQVIAYTLVMLRSFQNRIPILKTTFETIDSLVYKGLALKNSNYFVMGQVCVGKPFRGQGVFYALYQHMKKVMQSEFLFVITEIALENKRSMRAHEKVGFEVIKTYTHNDAEWAIVLWDWN